MAHEFPGFFLQESPRVIVSIIPGPWLLKRTTPSWRIDDPIQGFQRRVSQERAKQIATAVLDQGRTFPNAIVLATNVRNIELSRNKLQLPDRIKFLVVDGQHRLWAQHFSNFEANYCCLIHFGLIEEDMARLFVEINDNQKRVPSSLRWDLVRLVRAEDDPHGVRAVDLIYELNRKKRSPLRQRIDLTGEQHEISLKQGSIAPEIKSLLSKKTSPLHDESYEDQLHVIMSYLSAIRDRDTDGWDNANGPLYRARVLRALFRLLADILNAEETSLADVTSKDFQSYLRLINLNSLNPDAIRGQQGSAGMKAIYDTLVDQVFE